MDDLRFNMKNRMLDTDSEQSDDEEEETKGSEQGTEPTPGERAVVHTPQIFVNTPSQTSKVSGGNLEEVKEEERGYDSPTGYG